MTRLQQRTPLRLCTMENALLLLITPPRVSLRAIITANQPEIFGNEQRTRVGRVHPMNQGLYGAPNEPGYCRVHPTNQGLKSAPMNQGL